jgi:hypothetical protein
LKRGLVVGVQSTGRLLFAFCFSPCAAWIEGKTWESNRKNFLAKLPKVLIFL